MSRNKEHKPVIESIQVVLVAIQETKDFLNPSLTFKKDYRAIKKIIREKYGKYEGVMNIYKELPVIFLSNTNILTWPIAISVILVPILIDAYFMPYNEFQFAFRVLNWTVVPVVMLLITILFDHYLIKYVWKRWSKVKKCLIDIIEEIEKIIKYG